MALFLRKSKCQQTIFLCPKLEKVAKNLWNGMIEINFLTIFYEKFHQKILKKSDKCMAWRYNRIPNSVCHHFARFFFRPPKKLFSLLISLILPFFATCVSVSTYVNFHAIYTFFSLTTRKKRSASLSGHLLAFC